MLLLGNLLKVTTVNKIKINIIIKDKELTLEIYNVALIPKAITSLLLEDQLKREDIKIMGNKLTIRQEIIIE